jgi:hypothetical protein
MRNSRKGSLTGPALVFGALVATAGCYNTPVDVSEFARGPAPLRMPSPEQGTKCCCYEDSLTGGEIFHMYCSYCHNAPSLAERPFSQFRNVAAHMRVRANLTGKEYAKLMEFLRQWNDIPPPTPPVPPSPKRLTFSQPITELQPKPEAQGGERPQPRADEGPALWNPAVAAGANK